MRTRHASLAGLLAGVFALSLVVSPAIAAPAGRATLVGSVPSWATSAAFKSASDPNGNVGFRVYLGWSDQTGAEALARAVSDPRSASYGHYLTPAQFRARFAPSQSTIAAVQNWLRSQGFTVDYTPLNNRYVAVEGSVAQAEAAFGVQINDYVVRGQTVRSPASALTIPSDLASAVESVVGLDGSAIFVHTNHITSDAPPPGAFVNAPPCSTYWAEKMATTLPQFGGATLPYAPCGYNGIQLQAAYGVADAIASGTDGRGQTVAIIDAYASPTILKDADTYSGLHGLPTFKPGQFTQVVAPGTFRRPQNPAQDPQGWSGEETLDVEAVHTMAPGASIVYVGAPNNYQDLDAALNHVVDRGLAQIVTNSYGFPTEVLPPGYIKPYNDTFIQATIEGIGVYFSSGDNGDEIHTVGYRTADWPASSTWVTAVGGTSLAIGADNGILMDTGWGTKRYLPDSNTSPTIWKTPGTFLYASGGGSSCLFAQPSYQAGVVPDSVSMFSRSLCGTFKGRAVPDISMVGDPGTGMLIGQTQTFPDGSAKYSEYRIGGTSLSSPLFAGLMALADQTAGTHHGFANPAIYGAVGTSAVRDVTVHDLDLIRVDYLNGVDGATRPTVRQSNQTGTLATAVGYDDVTGVGTPVGPDFLNLP